MSHISNLNHFLTRADVWEKSNKAPIRRFMMPLAAASLAGAVISSDLHHTETDENKQKVALRDALAVTGTAVGLAGGIAMAKSKYGAISARYLAKLLGREVDFHHMPLSNRAKAYIRSKPWGQALGHHHHDHAPGSTNVDTKLGGRLSQLFKTQAHDHGIPGILMLESMAAGSILGGIAGGTAADHINREDLKKTLPAKLYESVFQFMGNITLCTVAILAGSWLGKGAARQAFKLSPMRNRTQKQLVSYLQKIQQAKPQDMRRVPTGFTEAFEQSWLKLRDRRNQKDARKLFQQELMHWFKEYYPKKPAQAKQFNRVLTKHLKRKELNISDLREQSNAYLSKNLKKELKFLNKDKPLNKITSKTLRADMQVLAKHRLEKSWERIGIIGGLIAGIIGGAVASNRLNEFLSKEFNFEKPVNQATLFHAKSHASGMLKDKVGPRGIHWWDMILHADDWPSAMYMAGVEMLEPIIRVLYGISGYLAGVAGTSYSHGAKPDEHPQHNTQAPSPVPPAYRKAPQQV